MESTFYPYLGALCWIGILLMVGTIIRAKVRIFQKLLFPASLIGGIIGFAMTGAAAGDIITYIYAPGTLGVAASAPSGSEG